jgi:hypothetical protein
MAVADALRYSLRSGKSVFLTESATTVSSFLSPAHFQTILETNCLGRNVGMDRSYTTW